MNRVKMRGWILYGGEKVAELVRACEEARAAGVELEVVAPKEVALVLDAGDSPRVFRNGVAIPLPMFALAAFVNESDDYNLALLQQLETQGVLCVNRAATLRKTGDKLLTLQLLAEQGIAVPQTILVNRGVSAAFVRKQLGLPVVVKVVDGSKGYGVTLVRTEKELENLLEMLDAAGAESGVLAQEFIEDSVGRDLRVLVVDGKPRVCMLRKNRSADGFKSNVSTGGAAEAFPMSDTIRALAERVIHILGLNIGGIDLLFKGDGFVVGEANSIPGFQGIESCNEINVPAEILMSIGRQLKARTAASLQHRAENIRSLDELIGMKEPELIEFFMNACSSVETVQAKVLMDIVRRNARTGFGEKHEFDSIHSVDDFRKRVPVAEWADFEPYARRMEQGDEDLLFAGRPVHFVCTSGTTGKSKLIPESREGMLAKSLVSRMRAALLVKMAPGIMDGFFIPLVNPAMEGKTASGIPFGYASGLTLDSMPPEIQSRLAFPPAVLRAADAGVMDYLIMRFAVARTDVRMLAGNNPGHMSALFEMADNNREELIADIEQGTLARKFNISEDLRRVLEKGLTPDPGRARDLGCMLQKRGRLEPRDYWPGLAMVSCWLGGAMGRYTEGLKSWLPEGVVFADFGYGASEGKFNLPLKPGVVAAPLALFSCFFEFIPLNGGEPLMAHELEDGAEYSLVITTYSGLYRYDLRDIVQVQGWTGKNPNIRFMSKSGDIASLAGEKLSGSLLADVVSSVLSRHGLRWRHFCVVTDGEERRYNFLVEPDGEKEPDSGCLADIDKALAKQSSSYRRYRERGVINPPWLIVMKQGWLARLYADKMPAGGTAAQVKLPVVMSDLPERDMIENVVETQ